jgi:CrcB protein
VSSLPDRSAEPRATAILDGRRLAAIAAGGALGALLRVWLGETLGLNPSGWPWVIFAINVSGSFALAYIATRLLGRPAAWSHWMPLLGIGFCGAYTTFSTMQVEILTMLNHDRYGLAGGYALASVTAGWTAIRLGAAAAGRW